MKTVPLVLGLAVCSFAQQDPLSCDTSVAATPLLRAEGQTELLGDLVIYCTGGTPTLPNQPVPAIAFQAFLSPVIAITSRLLTAPFMEVLLMVDDPSPDLQTFCGSPAFPYQSAFPDGLTTGVCVLRGAEPDRSPYDPSTPTPSGSYRGNVFQARRASSNSLVWTDVPFDPPGNMRTRTFRITNVRVNASMLLPLRGQPVPVTLIVVTSARGVALPIAIPIRQPSRALGFITPSIQVSTVDDKICHQCESANRAFAGNPSSPLSAGNRCDDFATRIRISELFPTAFQRRNIDQPSEDSPFEAPLPLTSQDTPGAQSSTETAFYKARPPTDRWPAVAENGSRILGPSPGALGLADHGTRIVIQIDAIPDGVQLWLARTADLNASPQFGDPASRTGMLAMVATHLQAETAAPEGVGFQLVRLAIRDHHAEAVYEVLNTDTTAFETLEIPLLLAWQGTTAETRPALGKMNIRAGLGPISAVAQASGAEPIPRFVDTLAGHGSIRIDDCRTHLLFPFVTGQKGFDTSLVILNTSKSPFNEEYSGACTLHYEGVIGTTQLSFTQTLRTIPAGDHVSWTLLGGGAADAMPGFQGYIIAECSFHYAHGFAFLADLSTQKLIGSYLGLVMDAALRAPASRRKEHSNEILDTHSLFRTGPAGTTGIAAPLRCHSHLHSLVTGGRPNRTSRRCSVLLLWRKPDARQ